MTALSRLLVIGQDPGPGGRADLPLCHAPSHRAGGRLRATTGLSRADYLRLPRANLRVDYAPGWDAPAARAAARKIRRFLVGRVVVCLGRRVCAAFEISDQVPWFAAGPARPDQTGPRVWFVPHPHPSGRCREWNDPEVGARARVWWSLAARLTPSESYGTRPIYAPSLCELAGLGVAPRLAWSSPPEFAEGVWSARVLDRATLGAVA